VLTYNEQAVALPFLARMFSAIATTMFWSRGLTAMLALLCWPPMLMGSPVIMRSKSLAGSTRAAVTSPVSILVGGLR
jgi:hypothetical protein